MGQGSVTVSNQSSGNPVSQGAPRPVTLALPGELSDADYAQLQGLTVPDKILQMRAILTHVSATRTAQQTAALGPFRWVEAVGAAGEFLFIGAAPPQLHKHTVVIILADGMVYNMWPSGLKGVLAQGPPKVIDFDLQSGNARLMVKIGRAHV